jgi:hypothetical protein
LLACARALAADAPPPIPRSQNLTLNLIRRLVQRGVLPQSDADELIKLAEEDAATARAEAAASTPAPAADAKNSAASATGDVTVRVTYVPEFLRKQIREEVKQDVMAQAREERWAAPRSLPEWATRYKFFGDFRLRGEGLFYPAGNDNTGAFPNFNAINTGAPFDVAGTLFSPQNNVDRNRDRLRLRARFGAAVDLGDNFTSGLRFGTGENDSPVTENQTLGIANGGQGGNFAKYALWLDRAFLKYEPETSADLHLALTAGRFDNPFFATNMLWSGDLGFDGLLLQARRDVAPGLTPFLTAGVFPVFNTELNFATNQPAKFKSEDKWLYAAQLGATWKLARDFSAKAGAAYYHFDNVEGRLSAPFTPVNASDAGSTDDSRPAFAQTGNTYMALRNIVPNFLNNFGAINQFQYFGLAAPFHELALTGRLDYNGYAPFQIALEGEWVNNLAFHRGATKRKAVNNLGATGAGSFDGGNNAGILNLRLGDVALDRRGAWNVLLGYRYVESDALVDGFCDADFGGTMLGTNHKGFDFVGNYALSPRVWLGLRWMSATGIAGPVFKNDYLQLDLNSRF